MAAIVAAEMLVAFIYAHVPRGLVPFVNGGELAFLYMVVWIFLATNGAGPVSVDAALRAGRGAR